MVEAALNVAAEALLEASVNGRELRRDGNRGPDASPQGVYRCAGDDDWVSIVARNDEEWRNSCAIVPGLSSMAAYGFEERLAHGADIDNVLGAWARTRTASASAKELISAGVPAAALASAMDLVNSDHLSERRFWETYGRGVLPALPWRASFGRASSAAPELGADTEAVLREVLSCSDTEITALRQAGAFGSSRDNETK